ncbi:MAG: toxin-antitoxin system HicB family antitoxin [Firmicutes bacterium HGW-Firmicutes-15]|nr:MAG: toxin-antitoxin system HicB family antitoxin [Firmicutes bacterium HGW-Firmicutes-15]
MADKKKSFPLRIDPKIYAALERWSQDELRSVNAHIEYLLREALKQTGRLAYQQKDVNESQSIDF